MRRPKSRRKIVHITDQLVDLFRKALPAERLLSSGKKLTLEQHKAALAAIHAFHRAADVPLWERFSPLHPQASGAMRELQIELLAKIDGSPEEKAWRAYARKWWKQRDAEIEHPPARRKRMTADLPPRSELRWSRSSGGW